MYAIRRLSDLESNWKSNTSNTQNGTYCTVKRKMYELLNKHERKISKAKERLDLLNQKTENNRADKANENLQILSAEKRTIEELLGQKKEFQQYSNNMLKILGDLENETIALSLEACFTLECKRFESALPIYSKKSEILNMISKHQVTIITAETGSGKSTQIVQYLQQQYGNQMIVCTQPRKVAAISLAKRVSEELESTLGETVGYRVGTNSMSTDRTSILFVTDHLLLNECLADPLLRRYKYIIIDEAHERSIPTDLLIAMVKKALDVRRELRLIISSATIDPKVFKDYFKEKAVCLHVYGRTFPVQVVYEEASVGNEYLQQSILTVKRIHENEKHGDILAFLTTPGETEKAQEIIKNDITLEDSIDCLILHGRLPPEEQQLAFEQTPPGKRKVVFATNSAETSITIPNIRYVIDSGMVKEKHYDKERNLSLLRVGYVNKSSAIQRQGRAGRTQEGKCFRLYTEEEYKAMEDEMLPEILRENLGIALLKLYQFGIEDPLNYDFVQPPSDESLKLAQKELNELSALQNNKLTRYGKIMATLGIEPKLAKFVARAIDDGIPKDAMVVAAVCSIGSSVFFRAGTEDDKQAADLLKVRFCKNHGDLITMLEVFKEWANVEQNKKKDWCFSNSMNGKTLRYAREMVSEMITNVERLLDIKIHNKFTDLGVVTERILVLLSECFKNNVAYFSGHVRGGYFIPTKGKDHFHLHPSAALSYLNLTPKWLLFTEVLCTSRTYIINTSVLPDHIGEAMFGRIAVPQIMPRKEWIVGKATARKLGFGRWESSQEQEMQENINENIYIGFDSNIGKVTLYSEAEHSHEAITALDKAICKEKKNFEQKLLSIPLSNGNPTSIVLQKGGKCSEILEQGEFNSILLSRRKDRNNDKEYDIQEITKDDVEEEFKKHGAISEVIQFRKGNHTWGKVIYQNSKSAVSAMKTRNRYGRFANMNIKPAWRIENQPILRQKYYVKARWTRLKARGFAFLSFDPSEAGLELIDQTFLDGKYKYMFQKARQGNDIMVKGINSSSSNEEIQLNVEKMYPHLKVIRCSVPRITQDIESKDILRGIKNRLSLKIGREIGQEYQKDRNFSLEMYPIKSPKAHDYEAIIYCNNLKDATNISNSSVSMDNVAVRFELEKKTPPIIAYKDVYYAIKTDLERGIKARIDNMKIKVKERQNHTRGKPPNEVEIVLEAGDSETLSIGRTILYDLVYGERMKFSEEQFRYFLTPRGREFINALKTEGSWLIKIDVRTRSLILYGTKNIRQKLRCTIQMKEELNSPYKNQWILDLNLQPNGFLKVLIRRYGMQLSRLYSETQASYINLNFLHHQLEVYGTRESVNSAKKALHEVQEEMLNNNSSTTIDRRTQNECPICFDILETTSYQLEVCGHSYCKDCIQSMCKYAAQNKQLPLTCAVDICGKDISIEDILVLTDVEAIVPSAVESFVAKNTEKYGYCITPDCMNVYSVGYRDSEPYQCGICRIMICTYCHIEYHFDTPCTLRKGTEPDEDLQPWIEEKRDDRGICPRCHTLIERIDGCNNMYCTPCGSYVCWRCKEKWFNNEEDCYDHLGLCRGMF